MHQQGILERAWAKNKFLGILVVVGALVGTLIVLPILLTIIITALILASFLILIVLMWHSTYPRR